MTRANAQTQAKPDERQTVISDIDKLNSLAWDLRRADTPRSLSLGEEALRHAQAVGCERGRAYSLLVLGYGAMRAADLGAALDKLRAARSSFEALGDREGSRRALNTLGIVFGQSGNYAGALETFLTLQRLCAELGEPESVAEALNNTGVAYFHLGDHASALENHLRALEVFGTLQDAEGEVQALINIGMVYFERGRFGEALDAFIQAQGKSDAEDDYTRALLLNHLGRTHLELGHYERALAHNEASLALMNTLGYPLDASYTQDDLAAVHVRLGNVERAEELLSGSLAVKRSAGDTKGEAEVCLRLGELYLDRGRLEPALNALHEGLASAQASHAKLEIHKTHHALAEAYKKNRQFCEAYEHLEKHTQLGKALFNQESDHRLQGLRVRYEVEQTEKEKEIYRLKNVELAGAVGALHDLTASLQKANDDKACLLEKLERLSHEDALTGLFNRRYVDDKLEGEFARAGRYGHPLSVAVCDIDYFKRVNDTFSHEMGDAVLRKVAELLQGGVRQSDTVARYGGEEFVVVFPEAPAEDAARIVERVREAVATYPWHTLHPDLKVTVSAGVSGDLAVESYEKLIGRADKKLYEAKHNGRNQVRV